MNNWFTQHSEFIQDSFKNPNIWETKIINKREPHTYRAYTQIPNTDLRLCIHRFEPCLNQEAFRHPHAWDAEFVVLSGAYKETIWLGPKESLLGDPVVTNVWFPDSWHEIKNPLTWHKVEPLSTTYTLMINGPEKENALENTRTTKGKDLDCMTREELKNHLTIASMQWGNTKLNWGDNIRSSPVLSCGIPQELKNLIGEVTISKYKNLYYRYDFDSNPKEWDKICPYDHYYDARDELTHAGWYFENVLIEHDCISGFIKKKNIDNSL